MKCDSNPLTRTSGPATNWCLGETRLPRGGVGSPSQLASKRRPPQPQLWAGVGLGLLLAFCPLAPGQGAVTNSISGVTEPYGDVILSAAVPGTVNARFFQEGDSVKKGQVILELDKRMEELTVTRRKLVMTTLKTEVEGSRHLYQTTQSVSKEDLDKKETEYQVAVVDHDLAVEQLRKRQVFAPFDGYLTEILLEVGEDCRAQDPLTRVVDTHRCYFVCNIEDKLGHALKPGQVVKLDIEAGMETVRVEGKLTFVSPVVDPASGLMKLKALFENPNGQIRPGAAGQLILESTQNAR